MELLLVSAGIGLTALAAALHEVCWLLWERLRPARPAPRPFTLARHDPASGWAASAARAAARASAATEER